MSQRGHGSGPHGDDPDGEDDPPERTSGEYPLPPAASRPIVPYDPYQPRSGDASRPPTRNVAANPFDPPVGPSSRAAPDDAFLPDDDPLSADAWQLELDEAISGEHDDGTLPEFDRTAPPPPRRPRRQPPAARGSREPGTGQAPRRGRTAAALGRSRTARPVVSIGVPRAVAGSSLVADQAALALLGLNAASILVMALLLGMRVGGIPSPTVLQLDAAGNPNLWGPPSVLWRLPVMGFFITLMFLTVAWFLHPIDRFAGRFALGAAIVVQAIAWVAVIQHLA